jgi:hypothetical protein
MKYKNNITIWIANFFPKRVGIEALATNKTEILLE